MAPKFVPRQRKHKVLARAKQKSHPNEPEADPNAEVHVPAAKAEREEKKRQLKEELQAEGPKVSGKKAKRLEKYIETKLRKDENRELIEKLATRKTDTSLYLSSKKLGQGKETKREALSRALREEKAGVDIDGENEAILYEEHEVGDVESLDVPLRRTEDEREPTAAAIEAAAQPEASTAPATTPVTLGAGLKRPLEVDEEGKPVLKKRKKRGGVKSKISLKAEPVYTIQPQAEPEWEGFSSAEDSDAGSGEESGSEMNQSGDEDEEESDEVDSEGGSKEEEDTDEEQTDESSDESMSEVDGEEVQARSSAFKVWANQQMNEAHGYKPSINSSNILEMPKVEDFKPRAPEHDPLPVELQPTKDDSRKAYAVDVNRTAAIQAVRLELPVVAEEQKIMEAIHNNTTVVIHGATGSGKTTQVPQFLYEAGYGSPNTPTPGMIGVTQPRRVAAVSMAKRVGDELGDHGKRVAYQIRFEGTADRNTAIKFMTDGVLLREVADDIALRKYSAIIIDEAHERSVNTDILIGMLSRVVKLRDEMAREDKSITPLKLIIMSATLRVTDFTENKSLFDVPPPVVQAEGRQFPVAVHFARRTTHDYLEEAFRKISKGHRKLPPGGILVFMTGQGEITHLAKRLKEAFHVETATPRPQVRISGHDAPIEAEDVEFGDIEDVDVDSDDDSVDIDVNNDDDDFEIEDEDRADAGPAKMHVLPLYSLLPTKEQLRVFEPPPDGSRMVVLATNVAETSLTIPGIRYVFDCGRSKERKYDPQTAVQTFEIGWISKASADQRSGRAGRTGPGHCYRLYSSAVYERDFKQFAEPEISRTPIEGVVLQLKAMTIPSIVNFPFPTPPDRRALASAEKLLSYLSALSPTGQITPVGTTMSIFPISPRFSRILLIGHLHDCIHYAIALVAGLSVPEVFLPENQVLPPPPPQDQDSPFDPEARQREDAQLLLRRQFNKVHKQFCFLDDKSDAIKLLQVVGEFAHEPTEAWCKAHFVRYKSLKETLQLRRQITDLLRDHIPAFAALKYSEKLPPPSDKQVLALKQMVAAGFIDHVAIRADLAPTPADVERKPKRAIDVGYLTLFPRRAHYGAAAEGEALDPCVYVHPSSPMSHLSVAEMPQYIVYQYLQRGEANVMGKIPKTRMRALTDVSGGQVAALAKGTPLVTYGKPIKEVKSEKAAGAGVSGDTRECWVVPYLRAEEAVGGMGWPLPARKVTQKKVPGRGWVVE